MRARASPTDAVTTVTTSGIHRRVDVKLDLQSTNSSVCGGDDPEDLTINSIQAQQQQQHHQLQQHLQQQQQHSNNNLLRYGPADVQLLQNKFPTAMELIDNYARSGGGGGGTGGALSPFLPSFAKDHYPPGGGADKMSPYNNKAFLDSYLKALVETNPPLFKIAGDIIKHDEIAADDAEYSSGSDEEEDEDDEDSVNNSPLPLQAGKN